MSGTALIPSFSGEHDDAVTLLKDELSFKGFFRLRTLTLRHRCFNGESITITRELFDRGRAVCVLLYDPARDTVVLIEQFRTGAFMGIKAEAWQYELVAGMVEEGESDREVARREAVEEAGADIQGVTHMLDYFVSPGGTNEQVGLYCAWVDSRGMGGIHGLPEEGEDIRVVTVPLADAIAATRNGRINNAATLLGLQWLQLHRDDLLTQWQQQGLPIV